jgi:hypothetical protein
MNIPIVQGTAVVPPPQQRQHHQQKSTTTNAYHTIEDGDATYNGQQQQEQSPHQPADNNQYKDVLFGIAFIVHLLMVLGLILYNMISGDVVAVSGISGGNVVTMVAVAVGASLLISSLALTLMIRFPTEMIKLSLICSVFLGLVSAVFCFMTGQVMIGVLCLVAFVVGCCYAKMVWFRIPFAAANLTTALSAVQSNKGLYVVAYGITAVSAGWSTLWFIGLGNALAASNGGILFLLFLSYYWTTQVLSNIVHVTTAGVVGTWWFVPFEAGVGTASFWSQAVTDSFSRATTYSFGSICLGSLLVAIIQALRALASSARQNDDCQILVCIIDCILACIQDMIEYFNQWAYVYVGLYGFSYIEAGKNVFQLFQQKGWTVIITDDLNERVLLISTLGVGFLTGFVGWTVSLFDQNLNGGVGFFIGFVVGYVISSTLLSVVGSAVNTVIVCFAESPAEFEQNHQVLSAEMRSSWVAAWPELTI